MNIYAVTLHEKKGFNLHMPYYFTNKKKAYLYGEYKLRTSPTIQSYKVEKLTNITRMLFYTLK